MTATRPTVRRRGAILLVVLALLALFAVIGLSFVLYAESEATAARIYREAKSNKDALDKPRLAGQAVAQLVWGTTDPTSAFTGHDLARLLYGVDGTVPYNGVGLYHEPLTNIPGLTAGIDRANVINHALQRIDPTDPNTWAVVDAEYTRANGSARVGTTGSDAATLVEPALSARLKSSAYLYVPKNAPYTYPDRNNLMVAVSDPTTGRVVVPSAHRPSLFRTQPAPNPPYAGASDLDAANPNWFNASGRFKVLRPRPIDQLTLAESTALKSEAAAAGIPWPIPDTLTPGQVNTLNGLTLKYSKFPFPTPNPDGTLTGDVQNYKFGNGVQRNDSVWLDAGLPVQEYKGRRLAPLVALTLLPLDGRVNLNASGNLKGASTTHVSNQGFAPHEINLGAVLAAAANATTFTQTKYGTTATPAPPGANAAAKAFPPAPAYGQVDWGGTATANWMTLPGSTATNGLASSPAYTTTTAADAANHPALWNAFQRAQFQTGDPNTAAPKTYPLTDLKMFGGRYSGKSFDYQNQTFLANSNRGTSSAFQTEFQGSGAQANRARALTTPYSVGFAKGGASPNYFNTITAGTITGPTYTLAATGSPVLSGSQLDLTAVAGSTAGVSDEKQRSSTSQVRVQNLRAALGAVNLNRPLADYRVDITQPLGATGNVTPATETAAWNDRQQLAADIFIRLCVATGAKIAFDENIPDTGVSSVTGAKLPYSDNTITTKVVNSMPYPVRRGYVLPQPSVDPMGNTVYKLALNPVPPANGSGAATQVAGSPFPVTTAEYDALRYLAQLAANIVDQVDNDDVSTAFVWNPATFPATPATATSVPPSLVPATAVARTDTTSQASWATSMDGTVTPGTPTPVEERAVFGTEKPRLVLNEVYAQIANKASDASGNTALPPNRKFEVRFFVELLNPNPAEPAPTTGVPTHPLAYETQLPGPPGPNKPHGAVPLQQDGSSDPANSPYKLVVYNNHDLGGRKRLDMLDALGKAGNVRGDVPPIPAARKIDAPLNNLAPFNDAITSEVSWTSVEPNQGLPSAYIGGPPNRNGFAVVGPLTHDYPGDRDAGMRQPNDQAFFPDPTHGGSASATDPLAAALQVRGQIADTDSKTLAYTVRIGQNKESELTGMVGTNGNGGTWNEADARHTVLLRRLANPYLPFDTNTNPYLTVDYQSQVEVRDAVYKTTDDPNKARPNPVQDDVIRGYTSSGRVQPFVGDEFVDLATATTATAGTVKSQMPNDGTQTGSSPGDARNNPKGMPKHSFFQHNAATNLFTNPPAGTPPAYNTPPTDANLVTPFDWLVQFDRPLINQAELLHASAVRPHELTHKFRDYSGVASGGAVVTQAHDLQHRGATAGTGDGPLFSRNAMSQAFDSPLYRAFDLLQTKPWTHGVPTDGRQAGRINLNMLFDGTATTPSAVFRAVLDGRPAGAGANGFTDADVDLLWTAVVSSRSPQWAAGAGAVGVTADELGANPDPSVTQFDRPFKGLGTGLFTTPATSGTGVTYPTGGSLAAQFQAQPPGLEDTLLRRKTQPGVPDPAPYPSQLPGLFQNPNANAQTAHPYQQWEPLRKVMNSFSTTTDSYLLLVTVGFFEVLDDKSDPPQFDAANRPARVLRAEAYDDAPGDLRAQFVAVIDRTGVAADTATGTALQSDRTPWTIELQNTVASGATSARGELLGGFVVAQDPTTFNGVGPPTSPQSDGTFSANTAAADAASPGFQFITPVYQRNPAGTGAIVPGGTQSYSITGTYDGVPITLAVSGQGGSVVAPSAPFWLGAGDHLELVEAFFDGNDANRWSYNPTTGALRVNIRPALTPQSPWVKYPADGGGTPRTTLAFTHGGGTVASSVVFRNPGPQPSRPLKVGQSDPVVRMFTELK